MPRGGKRPNAGRPKGARNKRTVRMIEQAQSLGLLPHEFLAAVARGEGFDVQLFDEDGEPVGAPFKTYPTLSERIAAASTAAPFFAPRLAHVEHAGGITVTEDAANLSDDELASIAAADPLAPAAAEPQGGGRRAAAPAPDAPKPQKLDKRRAPRARARKAPRRPRR